MPDLDVAHAPPATGTSADDVPDHAAVGVAAPGLRQAMRQLNPRGATGGLPAFPMMVAGISGFFTNAEAAGFAILLVAMQRDLHFNGNAFAIIGIVTAAVAALLGPVFGFLADRSRRTRLAGFGELFGNATILAGSFAPGLAVLTTSRVFNGLGGAMKTPVQFPLLADSYPPVVRGRVFAFATSWGFLGSILGPLIASGLATLFSWRVALAVIGGAGTAAGLLWFAVREPGRGHWEQQAGVVLPPPMSWNESWRAARSVRTLRRLWYAAPMTAMLGPLLVVMFIVNFAFAFGLSIQQLGYVGVGAALVSYFSLAYFGPLVQGYIDENPARVMVLLATTMALSGLFLVAVFTVPYLWMSLLAVAAMSAMTAVNVPANVTLIAMVVPPRVRGFGLASVGPWNFLGLVFGLILLWSYGTGAGFYVVIPILLGIGAIILGTSGSGVAHDIRAAQAAALADAHAQSREADGGPMLVCRDVAVTYDATTVLQEVDLDVGRGELIALLGTNGAGKSTLLRALTGQQEPSAGAVFFDGVDITHKPAHEIAHMGVVFVPGGRAIFPNLTVAENLDLAAAAGGAHGTDRDGRRQRVLELFPELTDRLGQLAGRLSGGEQQMVALGQALVNRPALLLIDELSLGLAPAVVDRLLTIVREINAAGTTVMLVEQSVNVALTVARRALFMDKGRIQFDGTPQDLLNRPDLVRSVFFAGSGSAAGGPALGAPRLATSLVTNLATVRPRGTRVEYDGPTLQVSDISLAYGGHQVLSGVSFALQPGEITGVIGPNGAGKTSLLDVISGFTRATSGSVSLNGTDVTSATPDQRARLGMGRSFQNAKLFPHLSVRETIGVALERHVRSRAAVVHALWLPPARRSELRVRRRVDQLVELLNLESYAGSFVSELSVGTRRMVDVACMMASEPSLLLLDEPSSGVAQAEVELFAPVIQRLARDSGCAVLVIEHDIPLVTVMSDRLLALELGRVIAEGDPTAVLDQPDVIAAYLAGADPAVIQRSGESALTRSGRT